MTDQSDPHLPQWNTQDAKARFSFIIHEAEKKDQLITSRGRPAVVIISKKRYDSLIKKQGSLLSFFRQAPLPQIDLNISRDKGAPRDIDL